MTLASGEIVWTQFGAQNFRCVETTIVLHIVLRFENRPQDNVAVPVELENINHMMRFWLP